MDEEEAGAAGGENLHQGIGTLMAAMRDLLNNIQPVAPPREDEQNPDNPEGEVDEWD